MALSHSPKIPTDGLLLYIDQANTKKSWKGEPVTNEFGVPTPDENDIVTFPAQGSANFYRVYSGTYGGYGITPDDVVYRYDIGATDCPYHGYRVPVTTGQQLIFTADYYISPSTVGYPITNYIANLEDKIGGNATDPTPSIIGKWKTFSISGTASADGLVNCFLYPGACTGGRLAESGFILYKNPQVLLDKNYSVPYVNGTRSNTQAIIDMVGGSTITNGSAITYNSDNTYEHAPSNDNSTISIPLNTAFNKLTGSINMWIYPNAYSGSNGLFVNRDSSAINALNWLWIGSWSSGGIFYFRIGDGIECCTNQVTLSSWSTNYAPVSVWTNLCATWESGVGMKLFVNGVLQGQRVAATTWPDTNPTANGTIGLGHSSVGTGSWDGKIESTAIYDRALTADEVSQNFEAIRSRFGI